jgi:hypothetical protein
LEGSMVRRRQAWTQAEGPMPLQMPVAVTL